VILAGRVLIAAMIFVMAERVLMAVILIVEDDVFIREIAELMIEDRGPRYTFGHRRRRGAFTPTFSSTHDALFADIYLKTAILGGFELAHQAINLRPKLRVLYTTGNSIIDKMTGLFVEGAHFLQKPYTQHQLQNSLEEVLAA
jgi:DNA-binding NtrC family response regulator